MTKLTNLGSRIRKLRDQKGLTQAALAEAMGVQRRHLNELCNGRRSVTVATACLLGRVFGSTPDFRLGVQRRTGPWRTQNDPAERQRIERARPLRTAWSCPA